MNNLNFNFWLQGYFEIMGPQDNNPSWMLTHDQVKCIREHLVLVKSTEPLYGFAAWLEGYLDARATTLGAQDCSVISIKLNDSFTHVVPAPSASPFSQPILHDLLKRQFGSGGVSSVEPIPAVAYC